MSKRTPRDNVKRLQAELPMMGAGMCLTAALQIVDLLDRRKARYQEDAYLQNIRRAAGTLLVEARALQRTAALITDYDAAHELLRREDG
jgi:hypothetical protein